MADSEPTPDAASATASDHCTRLEQLWSGAFGDAYMERNADAGRLREPFWTTMIDRLQPARVLEVGCNLGGNLMWIGPRTPPGGTWGVDVNAGAVQTCRREHEVNAVTASARDLPFRDRWFDLTFTMGVLIHQPPDTLPLVMGEMVRTSRRYVLCGEYFADEPSEIPYRGQEGALFKRDFGAMFRRMFPELREIDRGFLGPDEGWDDVTWWLFERTA